MKKLFILGIAIAAFSCSGPKSDAEKVCECYQTLTSENKDSDGLLDKAKKMGDKLVNKCAKMQMEMTKKYADDSEKLTEFNTTLLDCKGE